MYTEMIINIFLNLFCILIGGICLDLYTIGDFFKSCFIYISFIIYAAMIIFNFLNFSQGMREFVYIKHKIIPFILLTLSILYLFGIMAYDIIIVFIYQYDKVILLYEIAIALFTIIYIIFGMTSYYMIKKVTNKQQIEQLRDKNFIPLDDSRSGTTYDTSPAPNVYCLYPGGESLEEPKLNGNL